MHITICKERKETAYPCRRILAIVSINIVPSRDSYGNEQICELAQAVACSLQGQPALHAHVHKSIYCHSTRMVSTLAFGP